MNGTKRMTEWILIKDKLPPMSEWVIVCVGTSDYFPSLPLFNIACRKSCENDGRWRWYCACGGNTFDYRITHWAELPKRPPKELK